MSESGGHRVRFSVLGPLRVTVDGQDIAIPSRRQRALLQLLCLNVGRPVSAERLIEELWDGAPPPQAAVTLRSYISNLRQALGGREGPGGVLSTRGQGYALDVPPEAIDAVRLRDLAERGRRDLREGRPSQALDAFEAATTSWAGDPLAEVSDHEAARSSIAQLTEAHLGAMEGRFEALLQLGRHRDALPDLEAFTAAHPLREEPRALLMLALYRDGRAAEALQVHRDFRSLLNDELGIDPSPRLDVLNQHILAQDPALDAPTPEGTTGPRLPPEPSGRSRRAAGLVGREREIATLLGHLEDLPRGRGFLTLLSGEPGIGKSSILEWLEEAAAHRGIAVHRGRAPAAAGAPAFWPWTQVLDSVAAALDDEHLRRASRGPAAAVAQLSPHIAQRVRGSVPLTGDDPQALRFRLYDAVSAFLQDAVADRPLLITLDDLQHADLSSLELLSYVTPVLASRPIGMVAAYRDLPADRSPELDATLATVSREDAVDEIPLTGLTRSAVAELLDDVLGEGTDATARDGLVDALHERTGGNPFFVHQLARTAPEAVDRPADPAAASLPPGVRHVIARRLAGTPRTARDLLSAGAVLGRDFDVRMTSAMVDVPLPAALDALDDAAGHGLVELGADGGARGRFVHGLVREVVLHLLPDGRAAQLHAAAAGQLERSASTAPSVMAEHLWQARGVVGGAAIPAQLRAADAAAALLAFDQVELHLRRALELVGAFSPDARDTELEILLRLHRVIASNRGWGDSTAREIVARATELLEAGAYTDRTAPAWWGLFRFLLDRADTARCAEVARSLMSALADGRSPQVGAAAAGAVHLMNVFGSLAADDPERAHRHLESARGLVEAAPAEALAAFDENLHVMLYLVQGHVSGLTGDLDRHHEAVEVALALADADGRPFPRAVSRTLSATSSVYLEDVELAGDMAEHALDLNRRFGFSWMTMIAECVAAWATGHREDPLRRAAVIESALETLTARDRLGNQSILNLMAADLYAVAGDRDRARAVLEAVTAAPGPYQGLMVAMARRRVRGLSLRNERPQS